MEEILDHTPQPSTKYSLLSYKTGWLALGLLVVTIGSFFIVLGIRGNTFFVSTLLIVSLFSSLLGSLFAGLSLFYNEPSSYKKKFGIIVNFVTSILIIAVFIYVFILISQLAIPIQD